MAIPKNAKPTNLSIPAAGDPKDFKSIEVKPVLKSSTSLSMEYTVKNSIKTRKIEFLIANGVNETSLTEMKKSLITDSAVVEMIGTNNGTIQTDKGTAILVDESLLTSASVFYDAVFVPGGEKSIRNLSKEAYKHCKPIALAKDAYPLIEITAFNFNKLNKEQSDGLILEQEDGRFSENFIKAIASHRFWEREIERKIPLS